MKTGQASEQIRYWDDAWPKAGVHSFSLHTKIIEEAKWNHLRSFLHGYSGHSLEVGCGSGHFSSLMAGLGFDALLLDYSSTAIQCARNSYTDLEGGEKKKYIQGDALFLPMADSKIDVVLSCGLLEHIENPFIPIKEMVRVLRPGGLFYADVCPKKFKLIDFFSFLHLKKPGWHEAPITKSQLNNMLREAGLRDIRVFGAGVLSPRDFPGTGRIKFLKKIEKRFLEASKDFWMSLDGTRLADLLGLYYFVVAKKPF